MRSLLVACLLLTACYSGAELSHAGARVVMADFEPPGCRALGTVREAEGGGLRSYITNRELAEARLRNQAATLGGNALMVIDEERGDTDVGAARFATGVAGMTTPNTRCTNCVEVTARVYACAAQPTPEPVADAPRLGWPAAPLAAPTTPTGSWGSQPSWGAPPTAPPPIIIILQPPMAPPPER